MDKLRLFVKNFIVYGMGGIVGQTISLIMVPIVTRIVPKSEYFGISDLSNTIVSFASAFAVMGMYDAMYRMFFEKDDLGYKKTVCSTTLMFNMVTSIVVFLILVLFKDYIAFAFFKNAKYSYVVYISAIATLVGATNSIVSAPTRMLNKKKIFLTINILSPVISYSVSIPLLLAGHYIIALPMAGVISGIITEVAFVVLNHEWFDVRLFDRKLLKEMIAFALPLLPSFLVYWVFNSSDRVMISHILDLESVGIYSVASKIGMCSQLIYTAFAGGWQYFAFSTMKEEKQVENNSKIFEYLGVISFSATALLCAMSFVLFKVLFPSQYIEGYVIAPYLFLAPLLQMLYQVTGNQFLIVKKTWPTVLILSTGAIANVVFNYFLIPVLGIEGAAIGTVLGYTVTNIVCIVVLLQMKLLVVSKEFLFSILLTLTFLITWRLFFSAIWWIAFLLAGLLILLFCILYRKELSILYYNVKIDMKD